MYALWVCSQVIFESIVEKRFAVAQLTDEGRYLLSGVTHEDDVVAGLMEDIKEISSTFDQMKFGVRRKLVDLKQTFETTVVEVCLSVIIIIYYYHRLHSQTGAEGAGTSSGLE